MKTKHYTINSEALAKAMLAKYAKRLGRETVRGKLVAIRAIQAKKLSKGQRLKQRSLAMLFKDRGERA